MLSATSAKRPGADWYCQYRFVCAFTWSGVVARSVHERTDVRDHGVAFVRAGDHIVLDVDDYQRVFGRSDSVVMTISSVLGLSGRRTGRMARPITVGRPTDSPTRTRQPRINNPPAAVNNTSIWRTARSGPRTMKCRRTDGPVIDGVFACQYRRGRAGRLSPASPVHPWRLGRNPMPDLLFILLIVVVFALLALVVRAVEKL